ncbi:hypothetical protein EH220_06465 [bacterium]|nr:MAG: hypothetical protein EH220_06465 [bacterium]
MIRNREEVVNVMLAVCLEDTGLVAVPEQIITLVKERSLPDVLVSFLGLRFAIEGKFADHANARIEVQGQASSRVRSGISHIALGIIYPPRLREVAVGDLVSELRKESFEFCVWSEVDSDPSEWLRGSIEQVEDTLRRLYQALVEDDIVTRTVERIRFGTAELVDVIAEAPGPVGRIADLLGISLVDEKKAKDEDE